MISTHNANLKVRLKQDWYALRLNAFPHTAEELLQQAHLFPKGTVFENYGSGRPSTDDDCVENDGPYGWMYWKTLVHPNDGIDFAHMYEPTLSSWRSWPEMFEEVQDV